MQICFGKVTISANNLLITGLSQSRDVAKDAWRKDEELLPFHKRIDKMIDYTQPATLSVPLSPFKKCKHFAIKLTLCVA